MNLAHNTTKLLITGASGMGKSTYFTRYLTNSYKTIYPKICIFDHQGELSHRLNLQSSTNVEELVEQWEAGMVVYDPSVLFPGETLEAWEFFCDWVFERSQNNLGFPKLLAVDEIQMFSSTSALSWELCCCIETGRKYELDFVGISQQLNLVHNRLRNQLTELVTFRCEDKLILDALEEKGFNSDEVRALAPFEFLGRNTRGENFAGKITVDSGYAGTRVKEPA